MLGIPRPLRSVDRSRRPQGGAAGGSSGGEKGCEGGGGLGYALLGLAALLLWVYGYANEWVGGQSPEPSTRRSPRLVSAEGRWELFAGSGFLLALAEQSVTLEETLTGCEKIIGGDFDKLDASAFYMIGQVP